MTCDNCGGIKKPSPIVSGYRCICEMTDQEVNDLYDHMCGIYPWDNFKPMILPNAPPMKPRERE